jgi:ribosomal protein S27E
MSESTSMDDYRDASGQVAWSRYRAAQVRNGERCCDCDAIIITIGDAPGYPRACGACNRLRTSETPEEHDKKVRCPKCRHTEAAPSLPSYESESIVVSCEHCGEEYEVKTRVTVHFESPATFDPDPVPDPAPSGSCSVRQGAVE